MKNYVIFVGNPGVGKSTLLNCLVGGAKFESGLNFGGGLTKFFQSYEKNGTVYGDTPGLSDVKLRKQAAEEITKALQQNGNYKILFVCKVDSGRVRPDDVTTINSVIDAIKIKVDYGIIVNQCTKGFLNQIKDKNSGAYESIFGCFNSGDHKTDNFYFFPRDDQLEEINNKIITLPKEFIEYIDNLPSNIIFKENVQNVQHDQWEKEKEKYESEIKEIKEDSKKVAQVLKETSEKLEKEKLEHQKQQEEQAKKFEEKISEMTKKMDKDRLEHQQEMQKQQQILDQKLKNADEENKKHLLEQRKQFDLEMEKKNKEFENTKRELSNQMEEMKKKEKENEEKRIQREKEKNCAKNNNNNNSRGFIVWLYHPYFGYRPYLCN